MAVVHGDDETLGADGTIARLADEGVRPCAGHRRRIARKWPAEEPWWSTTTR
ncbi:hypothetical protein [Streptomyces sp. NPDC058953]|uniref:hypothetical protein n=1 Tax=unclassified Streptomyces TaxID=2593676 RepID=UPI0036B1C892